MAHEFVKAGDHHVNLSNAACVRVDGNSVAVTFVGGSVETFDGEAAEAIAKAVGHKVPKAHDDGKKKE